MTQRNPTHLVEASINCSLSIFTSAIGVGEEVTCTSSESPGDVPICRNCALVRASDVQVDSSRAFVVYIVLTRILPHQRSGQDTRRQNEWKQGSQHVE